MPQSLTQGQMNELQQSADAGDITGYYTALQNDGYAYGRLGLSAANGINLEGQTAQCYLNEVGGQRGVNLSGEQLHHTRSWLTRSQ